MATRRRRRGLRPAATVVAVVAVSAVAVLGAVWLFQDALIYHPDRSRPPSAATVLEGGRDLVLTTDDGLELTAWFVAPAPGSPRRDLAVLVAPGNGGNRLGRADFAGLLAERGFAVLLLDYRGYGGNPGRPSESGLASDARAAQQALVDQGYLAERTLYFGESLGTGVVASLQAEIPPAGIVLRSPFTSLADAGAHQLPFLPVRALLRDGFPVLAHIAASDVPVTVVHGDSDSVVPSRQSAAVAAAAPRLVEHLVFEGADHNDAVMFGPPVADAVARLADQVSARS